ncbi:MAG: NrpR regulatory domain-containing protein [Candidatus Methanoperedens sp.]|nr:NrpR regulatory domain-containing protein [Candidatus Methanoperedens sp.]MCZ7370968.1 NrpR regulatory domain-containing protein [Candidatus Methanoperedens sp.]
MNTTTIDSMVQRKLIEILRILYENHEPIGARLIADRMNERGYPIGERGVRYHLRILDERGLTQRQGYDGRVITERGIEELNNALVGDRLGFIITRIEKLIYDTTFDLKSGQGSVIVNTSVIDKNDFEKTMGMLHHVMYDSYSISPYIKLIEEGTVTSDIKIPEGKIGIATMCSITIDGILMKNGIPVNTRYGGLLDVKNRKPAGFDDIIAYSGTSIDPMRIFISKRMTRVMDAVEKGSGKLLANLREIPASAVSEAEVVLQSIIEAKIGGIAEIGKPGKSVLNAPVENGKVGIVAYAGVNGMAAVEEMGIKVDTHPISTIIDFKELNKLE